MAALNYLEIIDQICVLLLHSSPQVFGNNWSNMYVVTLQPYEFGNNWSDMCRCNTPALNYLEIIAQICVLW